MNIYYVVRLPYSDELYHHGIKGQKWGIRRYQNPDGTLTEAGKKRYSSSSDVNEAFRRANRVDKIARAKADAALGATVLASMLTGPVGAIAGSSLTQIYRNKANKYRKDLLLKSNPVKIEEIRIPEGTKFSRTSLKDHEDEQERLYVALSKAKYDMDYYGKQWPNYLRSISNNPEAKIYKNTYEVKGEIIAPSYEKRKEIADKLISSNRKLKTELGKVYAMDQLRLLTGRLGAKTVKDLEQFYSSSSVKKEYKRIADSIIKAENYSLKEDSNFKMFTASIPTSGKLMDAYIKELKKEGYGAVFDDNANSFAPFIVFDSSMLNQLSSKELRKP